jgi:MFS family permease
MASERPGGTALASSAPQQAPAPQEAQAAPAPAYSRRNFWAWVSYQFFYRVGWQFKMESTLMAGVVTFITGSPQMMGLFATVNAFGRALSPLVASPIVDRFQHKRRILLIFWSITVAIWAVLTAYLWLPGPRSPLWGTVFFGACYTLFFVFLSATSVAQGSLLGKIIPATMRGRAMAAGMSLAGGVNAVAFLFIYLVIKQGHFPEPLNYALAFSVSVGLFIVSALSLLFIQEESSETRVRPLSLTANLRYFIKMAREDRNLGRLMMVNISAGIGGGMVQFYTGFWRETGMMTEGGLMLATLMQVVWQGLSSGIFGRMADARGNRAIIRGLMWFDSLSPLLTLLLGALSVHLGQWGWFLGVYVFLGLRFPVYQLLTNYLLENVPQKEHAMALGAVTSVQLLVAPAPLIIGAVAQMGGYAASFIVGSAFMLYGAFCAVKLKESRKATPGA